MINDFFLIFVFVLVTICLAFPKDVGVWLGEVQAGIESTR